MPFFGLADCNNFYCSCERVFHPELNGKPVVILSNNDGCVIARSEEAKKMGIQMGESFFEVKDKLEANHVAVFSSNYNLYGDMSKRVHSLLWKFTSKMDIYSIDESFLDLSDMGDSDFLNAYGKQIVRTVSKGTGIPISLGIAPTKTLSKIASKFAKKYKGYQGSCLIDSEEKRQKALQMTLIEDVWGIGRRYTKRLDYCGIKTAWDFTQKSRHWVQREMGITGVRTWMELKGESCISIEELPHKKSICTSRSFPNQGLCKLEEVIQAVANFAAQCVRKLREQKSVCGSITVFVETSRFRLDLPQSHLFKTINLNVPSNDLLEIVSLGCELLKSMWTEDGKYFYKRAGVLVWNICTDEAIQTDLFDPVDREKHDRLGKAIDLINRKNGFNTIQVAVQGYSKNWHLTREYLSHQYTTNLNDLLKVK